jgi:hypothetical protein
VSRGALLEASRAIDGLLDLQGELMADVGFLLERSMKAGCLELPDDHYFLNGPNSIVAIAYGVLPIDEQVFPCDSGDLAACVRVFERLPKHRKTKDAQEAMFRATKYMDVKVREFGGRS